MTIATGIVFAEEALTYELLDEAVPLTIDHWIEVGRKDVRLTPQYEDYPIWYEKGLLKLFTARVAGALVGYAVFFLRKHQHYGDDVWAIQDLMFLKKECREGLAGYKFVKFCDRALEEAGVSVIHVAVNKDRDYGDLLERIGYRVTEIGFSRKTRSGK